MGKIMKNGVEYTGTGGNASDVAYDSTNIISAPTVEGTQDNIATVVDGLGTASQRGVTNNLTQTTAGATVLDAYQGKVLNDKITRIGTIVNGTISIAANASAGFTTQGTISLSSGTYICTFGVVWPSSSAGRISAFITTSSGGSSQVQADAQSRMNAVSGVTTNGNNGAFIYTTSSTQTLYLRTWQNTGASLTPTAVVFHAIRIV